MKALRAFGVLLQQLNTNRAAQEMLCHCKMGVSCKIILRVLWMHKRQNSLMMADVVCGVFFYMDARLAAPAYTNIHLYKGYQSRKCSKMCFYYTRAHQLRCVRTFASILLSLSPSSRVFKMRWDDARMLCAMRVFYLNVNTYIVYLYLPVYDFYIYFTKMKALRIRIYASNHYIHMYVLCLYNFFSTFGLWMSLTS